MKCSIIRDLFMGYVSGVSSADTKELVEEHIENCAECKGFLSAMQTRVAESLRETDRAGVNVLKTMKRRLFRRSVLIGALASVVTIAVLIVGGTYLFTHDEVIPYEAGLVQVEKNYADTMKDKAGATIVVTAPTGAEITFDKAAVLDVYCTKKAYFQARATGRTIERNGEKIKLYYLCYTETLANKWFPIQDRSGDMFRLAEPQSDDMPVDRTEVYYIESPRVSVTSLLDIDYDAYRNDGVLIWSGALE